ncbi:unnamed protein product [Sympodiomycopsis kandeliae]
MLLYYTLMFSIFLLCLFAAYYILLYFRPSALPSLLRPALDGSAAGYLPLPTSFAEQIRSGFTSRYFDLEAHNSPGSSNDPDGSRRGETREGLDAVGLAEVREIMRTERLNFDRARLLRQERLFAKNGVDRYGMPLDSKAIVRL